jgi:acetyl esterase/lipase
MGDMNETVVLRVPAREIPVPTSVSPAAQRVLAAGRSIRHSRWEGITDVDGWRSAIAAQEEVARQMQGDVDTSRLAADVEVRDVGDACVYVARPTSDHRDDRIVLELHGGALVLGGGEMCRIGALARAARTGIETWSLDYRMPPDHPYPAALDDCVAAYRAVLAERAPDRIVVTGGSAGGNLAAALVLRARDEGLPLPAAVILGTPEVDLTESGDTFRTNLGVDTVLVSLMPVNLLYADGHDLAHPYLSPLFGDFEPGFPPTLLSSGTRDLFLSNTVRMHRALRRAGVAAELHVLEAAPHGAFLGRAPEDAELAAEVDRFVAEHCPPRP